MLYQGKIKKQRGKDVVRDKQLSLGQKLTVGEGDGQLPIGVENGGNGRLVA